MIKNVLLGVEILRLNKNLQKMDKLISDKHSELKSERERY